MAAYILVVVWVICAITCYYIAKIRNVKPSLFWRLVVVFLGPIAIPLLFLTKSDRRQQPVGHR